MSPTEQKKGAAGHLFDMNGSLYLEAAYLLFNHVRLTRKLSCA